MKSIKSLVKFSLYLLTFGHESTIISSNIFTSLINIIQSNGRPPSAVLNSYNVLSYVQNANVGVSIIFG